MRRLQKPNTLLLWLIALVLPLGMSVGCSKKKKKKKEDETETSPKNVKNTSVEPTTPRVRHRPVVPRSSVRPYRPRRLKRDRYKRPRHLGLGDKRLPRSRRRLSPLAPRKLPSYKRYPRFSKPSLLTPGKRRVVPGPPPELTLITASHLAKLLPKKARFRRTTLPGILPDGRYNVVYFEPQGGQGYGIGVQVWLSKTESGAQSRLVRMKRFYPNVEATTDVGKMAFLAYRNDIVYLNYFLEEKKMVVSVTCSRKLCPQYDDLLNIARMVRIQLLKGQ